VVTWLPTAGNVIDRGRRLYELNDRPVLLFYGSRPAFRSFTLGMSNGTDVRELKQNLLALGFDNDGRLTLDDHFDLATRGAVKDWQRANGLGQTGAIPLGTVAFLPHAVRVTGPAAGIAVGATPQSGGAVLDATDTRPAVLAAIDPGIVSRLAIGDRVLITLPDGSTAGGRVANIGRVATVPATDNQGGGQAPTPTIPVTISLRTIHTGALDQAPVQVAITTQEERHTLAVPISALLALPGGGYAVRVASGGAWRSVAVTTGLFDDVAGRVAIAGPGLRSGMRVQIPS
jgi:peptidoglycan hydrolase-like protein with peptidoglycan-binding domain